MAYIPEHARLLGLESMDWLVLLVGMALAGLLTISGALIRTDRSLRNTGHSSFPSVCSSEQGPGVHPPPSDPGAVFPSMAWSPNNRQVDPMPPAPSCLVLEFRLIKVGRDQAPRITQAHK